MRSKKKNLPKRKTKSRVSGSFQAISKHVSKRLPWLKKVKLRYCGVADKDHKEEWRNFAHTFHYADIVCISKAADKELTKDEMLGIFAHEFGHLVADRLGLRGHRSAHMKAAAQDEADRVSEEIFGLPIQYNRRMLEVIWKG